MPPETEVIGCPACKHLVRVPADWLGQTVQCPECKAAFTAPVRDGDRLTAAVLLTRPAAAGPAPRRRPDALLLLPAFGLMLTGFAGAAVNGVKAVEYLRDPAAAAADVRVVTDQGRKTGLVVDGPGNGPDREKFDDDRAAEYGRVLRAVLPVFALVGGVVFAGGLALALGRGYRLAQVGCALAVVNVPHGCCVPGAVFGAWGLLMLLSDEARAHFGRR